jgi:hypothetical protein
MATGDCRMEWLPQPRTFFMPLPTFIVCLPRNDRHRRLTICCSRVRKQRRPRRMKMSQAAALQYYTSRAKPAGRSRRRRAAIPHFARGGQTFLSVVPSCDLRRQTGMSVLRSCDLRIVGTDRNVCPPDIGCDLPRVARNAAYCTLTRPKQVRHMSSLCDRAPTNCFTSSRIRRPSGRTRLMSASKRAKSRGNP